MKKQVENLTFVELAGDTYRIFLNMDKDNFEIRTGRIEENPEGRGCSKINIHNKSELYELQSLILEAVDMFNELEIIKKDES